MIPPDTGSKKDSSDPDHDATEQVSAHVNNASLSRPYWLSPALWLAVAIGLACTLLQLAGLDQALRFDRVAIQDGAWWRLLSGNFVHLGFAHLAMNLAGLALVVALVWKRFELLSWSIITIGASLFVGIGLLLRNPEVSWYVGFSGTLHGLIIAGTLADLRVWPKSAAILLVAVVGKLAWEQWSGALPGSESFAGGRVIVDSHLYGAIGGAVIGAVLIAIQIKRARDRKDVA